MRCLNHILAGVVDIDDEDYPVSLPQATPPTPAAIPAAKKPAKEKPVKATKAKPAKPAGVKAAPKKQAKKKDDAATKKGMWGIQKGLIFFSCVNYFPTH